MSDRPRNPGDDFPGYFQNLRVSAQPFVPNVNASVFQPGGYPGNQMYGGPYNMGGQRGMQPPGMYNVPPHMMMHQPHMQGYMGGAPGYVPPGMGHYGQRQGHQQQMKHDLNHVSNKKPCLSQTGSGMQQTSSWTTDIQPSGQPQKTQTPSISRTLKENKSSILDTHPEVDSWEDININDETNDSSKTNPQVLSSDLTGEPDKPVDPVVSKGMVTSEHRLDETQSPQLRHEQQQEKPTESTNLYEQTIRIKDSESATPKVSSVKTISVPTKKEDEKENVNIVFIGHVDAGKSTIGGHIMYLTGQVDKRTLEKYEREAKEKNRETWYLSWALDTNPEERDKGKTVEVGRAFFETERKRFTILDAPGHAGFVPNMISGTVQADIGILVISARRGEFETGFERRGQTREHAMLAKTAGVKHLVVLVNKMDDPTVNWAEERYEECKTKLTPFLKKVGFNPKTDIFFIPVSGLTGVNLKTVSRDSCPWYSGPAFIPYLDALPVMVREDEGPFRMPVADKYKDMGTMVIGKVESGSVCKGSSFLLMPNRSIVEVLAVIRVEEEVPAAYCGDNIKLKLKGAEEEDISPGFVLCSPQNPCHVGRVFDAQVVILEYKSIICAGFSCIIHIHNVVEEVEIVQLLAKIDKKTGKAPEKPKFIKQDQTAIARFQTSGVICMEAFKEFPAMARFTLRDEGKTIAIGKVLKIIE